MNGIINTRIRGRVFHSVLRRRVNHFVLGTGACACAWAGKG